MVRLGLTGGIGSGKSTLAGLLARRGAVVIDADAISRATTAAGGAAMAAIRERFGPEMIGPDGALARDRMRERVFAEPDARQTLENIIHPLVAAEIARQADISRSACTVFDIPLLAESRQWPARLDRVLVVDCTAATQVRRVGARSGWTPAAVASVMQQQASRERRLAVADLVVFNDSDDIVALGRMADELADRFGL